MKIFVGFTKATPNFVDSSMKVTEMVDLARMVKSIVEFSIMLERTKDRGIENTPPRDSLLLEAHLNVSRHPPRHETIVD